jgi:hypothetical protein
MSVTEPTTSEKMRQELGELRERLSSAGQQMSKLMKLTDGNSTYRDDIIWLAQEINQLQDRIKKLESKTKQSTS